MSDIKFYLFAPSPPCRAVYMAAKALNVTLEPIYMDFFKQEHLKPEFTKVNPEHKAPTIVDGDFILSESRAIMKYLVAKYANDDHSLYPKDIKKRATIDYLLDYDLGVIFPGIFQNVVLPFRDHWEPTEENDKVAAEVFGWIESKTSVDTPYMTGNDVTLADLSLVAMFGVCEMYRHGMDKYPNSMAWYKRMQALPYYKEINQPLYDFIEMKKREKSAKA